MATLPGCLLSLFLSGCSRTAPPPAPSASPPTLEAPDPHELPPKKQARLPTGITLAYFEMGDPAGEPLLFLHGLTDSSRSFHPLLRHLTRLRPDLRLVAVDLRGHGASSLPEGQRCREAPRECFRPADFAADALALMDLLGFRQVTVVGHSMGSIAAQELALTQPERIRRIVLLGTSAGRGANPTVGGLILGLVEGPWKAALEAKGRRFPEEVYDLTPIDADPEAEKWMAANWVTEPLADPALLAAMVPETARVRLGAWIGATKATVAIDNRKRLAALTVPAFIAWGSQDVIVPRSPDQDELIAALDVAAKKGLTRYVWKQYGLRPVRESQPLDDVGHNLNWAVPEGLARDIAAYLKDGAPTADLYYGKPGGGLAIDPGAAPIIRRP